MRIAPRGTHRTLGILATTTAAVFVTACATRTLSEKIYDVDRVQVSLRGDVTSGGPVDRGFNQPVTISAVRLGHILSRIDLRTEADDSSQRSPAFAAERLFNLAEGVSKALAEADSSQEIVVMWVRKEKRFGIFDRDYLTSFVAYVKGEQLYLHVARTDWEIPEKRKDRLPQPHRGEHPMKFRVLPSRGMTLVDSQSVAVDWRSRVFEKETRTRVSAGGRVVRRTILFESAADQAAATKNEDPLPQNLSATALRRLADLEEQREKGQLSQSEYDERRREILAPAPASP